MGRYDGRLRDKKRTLTDRHGREIPVQPTDDTPMRRFKEAIDMDTFIDAFSEHDKYLSFLGALQSPDYKKKSFMTIAREFNITLHDMQVIYTDYVRHMALLEGLSYTAKKLPTVMKDVANNAANKMVVCGRCDGKKVVEDAAISPKGKPKKIERPCPVCHGAGEVEEGGDKHAIDKVYQTMKLEGTKAPFVAVQQNFNSNTTYDARMEKLLQLTANVAMEDDREEP